MIVPSRKCKGFWTDVRCAYVAGAPMHHHERDDAHKLGTGLMLVAVLVVAGYITVTALCLGTLMSLARRMQRRALRAADERPSERRYAGV
jgi:hypothetical protein